MTSRKFAPLEQIKGAALRALSSDSMLSRQIARAFHVHWHYSGAWTKTMFLGYPIQQSPFDLQVYHELIFRLRPEAIVQTGVAYGGSLLYFATLLDAIGADPSARVIGIDVRLYDAARTLTHPRITLIEGSSTDPATVDRVHALLGDGPRALVSLDSDHTRDHVLREIEAYKELVAVGSYLVVEDVDLNGHPVLPGYGPGPYEAAQAFAGSDDRFVRDDEIWKSNRMTSHGWYRRTREHPVRGYMRSAYPTAHVLPPQAGRLPNGAVAAAEVAGVAGVAGA